MTQKVTGVVIGTACGLVFLILSFLAVCHSRRLHVLRRRDARRYEISSTSGPDVVEEGAPPSYDAGTYTKRMVHVRGDQYGGFVGYD